MTLSGESGSSRGGGHKWLVISDEYGMARGGDRWGVSSVKFFFFFFFCFCWGGGVQKKRGTNGE